MIIFKWIAKWIVLSGAVMAAAYIVPGITVNNWTTALWIGLVLGIINISIKPLIKLLTLPLNVLTLGIFGLVINGLLFWLAASLINGFTIDHFWAAFFGALIVAVIAWIAGLFFKDND